MLGAFAVSPGRRAVGLLFALLLATIPLLRSAEAQPATITVDNTNATGPGSLLAALTQAEATGNAGSTIVFSSTLGANATITVDSNNPLPVITQNTTINGAAAPGLTISGGGESQVFFVGNGSTAANVTIANVTIAGGAATGGAGGTGNGGGGGGGRGAGGAIFINSAANVGLCNVSFSNNNATGGAGGIGDGNISSGGGGGGGMGGSGGSYTFYGQTGVNGGGGGGLGLAATGGGDFTISSAGGTGNGGGGGGGGSFGTPPASGGAGSTGLGVAGQAGQSGTSTAGGAGGVGGFGGGGGGGGSGFFNPPALPADGAGGNGGFGGGGGGSGGQADGGTGGFGGGGGGNSTGVTNTAGGVGGGTGGNGVEEGGGGTAGGGGGAAFGGAVFVASGGTLTIEGTGTFNGDSTTAGTGYNPISNPGGATNGAAAGSDIFAATTANTILAPGTGNTITSNGTIADDSLASVPSGQGFGAGTGSGAVLTIGSTANPGGTVVLNGANTYSGGTVVTDAALSISADDNLGASGTPVTLNAGATLEFTGGFTQDDPFSRPLTVAGDPTISVASGQTTAISTAIADGTSPGTLTLGSAPDGTGGGTLVLTGTNTYTGPTIVSIGTLALSGAGSIATSSGLSLAAGTTFDVSQTTTTGVTLLGLTGAAGSTVSLGSQALTVNLSGGTDIFQGTLQDAGIKLNATGGSLTLAGSGTLVLTGANTYTGGTTINGGTLQLGNGGTTGSLQGNVTDNSTLAFDRSDTTTFGGVIDGSGMVVQSGSGTVVLTGTNSYRGGTTVSSGTLSAASTDALGTNGATVDSGATLNVNGVTIGNALSLSGTGVGGAGALTGTGTAGITGPITLAGATTVGVASAGDTLTASGGVSGGFGLTKVGAGTLTLSGVASGYTGLTTVSAGTLSIGSGGSIAPSSGVTVDSGATFDISGGGNQMIGDLNGAANSAVTLGGNALTLIANGSDTFAGAISGAGGAISKSGTGTLTLTGTNGYTGATTISSGTLALSGTGSIAASSGVILSAVGANFDISGTSAGATVQSLSGVVGTTASLGAQTLTVTASGSDTFNGVLQDGGAGGGLTMSGSGILLLTQAQNYAGATTISNGTLALTGTGSVASSSGVTLSAAGTTFDVSDTTSGTTVQSLQSSIANTTVDIGAETLTVNVANGTDTFAGVITDGGISGASGGGVTKMGAGTLVLTGINSYAGATTISGGTLALNGVLGDISSSSTVALTAAGTAFDISGTQNGVLIPGLTGVSGSLVSLGSNTLSLDVSGTDIFAGTLADGGIFSPGSTGGNVALFGGGTLVLTGNNTFTGGIDVFNGTLSVGSQGNLGSGPVQLEDGTTLHITGGGTFTSELLLDHTGDPDVQVDAGQTVIWSNQILQTPDSTPLTLTLTGPGTLVLTADNTVGDADGNVPYHGGTVISAGTLQLGNGGTSGNVNGDITDNSALVFDRSDVMTFPGAISGSGTVTQSGTGTVVLTGTNAYTGGTTIAAGTLQIGNGGTSGSIVGNVVDNGVLAFDRSDAPIFTGNIAGTGTLTQAGTGTLILTGTNTYTGGTTISAGTLQIGNGGTSGSIAGNVVDNAALAFDRSDTVTLAGGISGSGTLTQAGSGTLIVTGTNTYTGVTRVSAGTLQVGNGGTSGSILGNIIDNSALAFDRSDTVTYAGSIAGVAAAAISQSGSGTLILDGSSSGFAGNTTVAAGTLEVGDASHASAVLGGNVTVNAGSTLMGHGTIGGNVSNGGTVQPGGTIGVLTVAGNYTQSSAGTLNIEITPTVIPGTGYDQLSVGGTASLNGGALAVIDDPGTYLIGSRYTIVTAAGGRDGTFATVSYNPLFASYITPVVSYDANDVYLTLDPTPSPTPAAPPLMFNGGQEVPDALTAMISSAEGVADTVLSDICGAEARRLTKPGEGCDVRPLAAGYQLEMWVRGLGGVGSLSGSGPRFSFSDDYGGMLLGAGVSRGGFTVGLGGGYLATGVNFSNGSTASQSSGLGLIYGRYATGPMWVGAMAAYGGGQVDGVRTLPGTGLEATGNRSGDFAIVQGRAAYDLAVGPATVEPRATLAYIHAGQDGFTETGAGTLDLTYPDTNADTVEGRLTVRAMRRFVAGSWSLAPWVEAGVQEAFSGLSRRVLATDGPFSAGVSGVSPAPTAGVVGVGLSAAASEALDFFVRYQGQFSTNQAENAFTGGLLMRF